MGFSTFTVRLLQLLAVAAVLPLQAVSAEALVPTYDIEERDAAAEPEGFHGPHLDKRQNAPAKFYPVIGHGTGVCFQRKKIEVLQAQFPAEFNMLVLAMENLMAQSETSDYSWFSVAGIHGSPKVPWQEAPISSVPPGTYDLTRGYCTHTSALFCTWHRPYTILLEQMLIAKAKAIAKGFTGSALTTYTNAANQVRLPYWDWSDPTTQSNLPPVTMQQTIRVVKPSGTVTIPNPFYAYRFKSATLRNTHFSGNFRTWDSTRRQPDGSGNSNNAAASSTMQRGFSSRRSQTYNALQQTTYNNFNSAIEGVHNGIHTNIGGDGGHMTYLDVSAFDPIFMLHHVNVDRMFMMWQASHPNVYMTPAPPTRTFGRPVDPASFPTNSDNLNTPLKPFRKADGIFWSSNDVRDARSAWRYGYGYPEVPCDMRSQRTAAEIRSFTNSRINALYGPSTMLGFTNDIVREKGPNDDQRSQTSQEVRVRKEYTLKFVMDHAEVDGSWSFHCFNGKPPADPSTWADSPNLIGSISDLGAPLESSVQNTKSPTAMKKDSMLFVKDIPLTEPIISKRFIVTEKQYADADKWLRKNLFWGMVREGEALAMENMETVKVGVFEKEVTYPIESDSDVLPTSSEPVWIEEITKNKVAGIDDDEDMLSVTLLNGAVVSVPKST